MKYFVSTGVHEIRLVGVGAIEPPVTDDRAQPIVARSLTLTLRLAAHIELKVANASTSVPVAVTKDEIVVQSAINPSSFHYRALR